MRRKPQKYIRKTVSWSIGFVLTGHVFHGLDWQDYLNAGPKTILYSLFMLGFICLGIVYLTLIMPGGIQFLLGGIILIISGLIILIFGGHWLGVKWVEENQ